MQLPRVMPKPQREPMGRHDSLINERVSPMATETVLEFGRFRVLLRQRRLLADGVPVELGTRAFDILTVLLEADGALVTKDELLSRVWPGIVVGQDNLKLQICTLRKALGEDRELIRTENGRGYRFIAAVHSTAVAPECVTVLGATSSPNGWNAASPPDFSVMASRLTLLEDRLAEALNLLETRRNHTRLRPRRHSLRSSSRRTRRRRQRSTALREKPFDLACC